MPCPSKKHTIYYPAALVQLALTGQHAIFQAMCECGMAYLVACQEDGTHYRIERDPLFIERVYRSIPWPERSEEEPPLPFAYKLAPSLDDLNHLFEALERATPICLTSSSK